MVALGVNVGLGTEPDYTLHVVGSGIFTESLTLSGVVNLARFTDAEKDAVSSPQGGAAIFNTSSGTINVYDGSSWRELSYA